MQLRKHVDTEGMINAFLMDNEVVQCPDQKRGLDIPLNSTCGYSENYNCYGSNVPGLHSRNYDPNKEKEHIEGECRACKKHAKFYVSDWRKLKTNRKRYATLCEDCACLPRSVSSVMTTFNTVEQYDDFIARHGTKGAYSKYTLKELLVMRVEAQNHSTAHTKSINEVIRLGKYKKEDTDTVVGSNNTSVLGYDFDF